MDIKEMKMELAGREFRLSNGPIATYADGYVIASLGETVIMANASVGSARDGDFFPLVVDYEENMYAAGKIKGSRFVKREGRPSENSVLISRMIDRPVRPLFPKATRNEVQVICTALSIDMEVDPGTTAMNAASMALLLTGAPFEGPIGAVRMGYVDGQLIVNPTYEQTENGQLDLIVAGTMDAITMVEAAAKEVPEEVILQALDMAHVEIKKICQMQLDYAKQFEIKKIELTLAEKNEDAISAVESFVTADMLDTIKGPTKMVVKEKVHVIEEQLFEKYAAEIEEEKFSERDLAEALNGLMEKQMRKNILEKEERIDGRQLDDVRPISVYTDVLPRPHGSALFQRGETMALSITTLGAPGDAQLLDLMDRDETKRYIHHYHFPPFSTGDIKPLRGPGRREIGHGDLAERALIPVIPAESEFPYTIWVVSEIPRCNGSSSMASVCGSTLSLMAAGVPIKRPVAGIAMGLVSNPETGDYKILTDIQGLEDFAGDMDFKAAGTSEGITALQMDIKIKGLSLDLLKNALAKAKAGRDFIMQKMLEVIPEPRKQMSKYAPLIMSIQIDPDMIRNVIGKGGETIQKITAECEVEMDINDDGLVNITAPDQERGQKAVDWVKRITHVPKPGEVFDGKVVKIMDFGAFVEFLPGKDGLVHISELSNQRVNKVEDVVKVGDPIRVKLKEVDREGRYNLSHKATLNDNTNPPAPAQNPQQNSTPQTPQNQAEAPQQNNQTPPSQATPDPNQPDGKGGQADILDGTQNVREVN